MFFPPVLPCGEYYLFVWDVRMPQLQPSCQLTMIHGRHIYICSQSCKDDHYILKQMKNSSLTTGVSFPHLSPSPGAVIFAIPLKSGPNIAEQYTCIFCPYEPLHACFSMNFTLLIEYRLLPIYHNIWQP